MFSLRFLVVILPLCRLTTYFEEPSCTTLASVTSNSRLSVCRLTGGAGLPPPSPRRLLQLSCSCRVSREEEEEEAWPTGDTPTGLVSKRQSHVTVLLGLNWSLFERSIVT